MDTTFKGAARRLTDLDLPNPAVAGTFLRRNDANTAYEALTATEVVAALNVKALNADGGFTFNLSAAPTQAIGTWFGGAWVAQHAFIANTTGFHSIDGGSGADTSRWAFSVVHKFDGSGGASGAARLDGAVWFEAAKNGWNDGHTVGTGQKGSVTNSFFIAANNEWGDTAAIVTNSSKIYGDTLVTNTTGSNLQYEGTTRVYNHLTPTTILRSVHVLLGYDQNPAFGSTVALHPGKNSGVTIEPQVGNTFAAYVAQGGGTVGGGDFEYLLIHSTNRNVANTTFSITGPSHAAGGGLIRAGNGSATTPSLSLQTEPGTGFFRHSANNFAFASASAQTMIFGNGLRLGAPAGGDPGVGSINIANTYRVSGTQVVGAQGAAVANATDAASVITQLNAWLARARAHGLIAT